MTGMEVHDAINVLRDDRRDEMHRLMKDYDESMNMQIKMLRERCPHDNIRPTDNGFGWVGTECVWCEKQLTNEYLV